MTYYVSALINSLLHHMLGVCSTERSNCRIKSKLHNGENVTD